MSNNPLNLALRFILELCALAAAAYWGWVNWEGLPAVILVIIAPLFLAVLWGVFRTPNEPPPANPKAPVPVKGAIRLAIEFFVFGSAVWCLYNSGAVNIGRIFGAIVLFHYLISYDRILWLLKH